MTFVCIATRITVQPTRSNTSVFLPMLRVLISYELLHDYCFPMPRRAASVAPTGNIALRGNVATSHLVPVHVRA